jgi:hypothetical protein
MKWYRPALACAAGLATIALTGLTPLPARADSVFTATWFTEGTGDCLGVQGGNMTNGTPIVQWPCNGNPDQTWEITTISGSPGDPIWTQIQDFQDPSKCLGVLGSATGDGSNLVIWDCNGNADQTWFFQQDVPRSRGIPFGCFNIVNFNAAPKVIGIQGASTAAGAQAVLWDLEPTHPDQTWCVGNVE